MNAAGVLALDELPVVPRLLRPPVRATDDKDLALARASRPTTTGTSTSGAAPTPTASSRWRSSPLWDADARGRRGAPRRGEGLPLAHRSPRTRRRSASRASTTSTGTRCGQACRDTNTVVSVHLGSSGQLVVTAPDAPVDVMITLQPMNICQAAADLLWSRAAQGVPRPQVRALRGRHRLDPVLPRAASTAPTTCTTPGPARTSAASSRRDVFREHFLTCFINDPVGVELRHHIGIDNICWELDYPHSDSTWPNPGEELHRRCAADVPDDEHQQDHLRERACAGTRSTRSPSGRKEQCTVAALRAESPGHDVSIKSMEKGRHSFTHQGVSLPSWRARPLRSVGLWGQRARSGQGDVGGSTRS